MRAGACGSAASATNMVEENCPASTARCCVLLGFLPPATLKMLGNDGALLWPTRGFRTAVLFFRATASYQMHHHMLLSQLNNSTDLK